MKGLGKDDEIDVIGRVLNDGSRPLKERFRALFTLRNLGGRLSIDWIAKCFRDPSALLTHECAYCLGQIRDEYAIPVLVAVLQDESKEPMVRHEAGEALGAIGSANVLDILRKYSNDPVTEVAETCQIAVKRIEWQNSLNSKQEQLSQNPYASVDPAPPTPGTKDINDLKSILLNESLDLFERYRAMFALRNIGDREAVLALCDGLKCSSTLFRHEIAYVLGQIQSSACVPQLLEVLRNLDENEMVRHECAEALGSIATIEGMQALREYVRDEKRVVKESCEVALDMCDYENSNELQYADTLMKVQNNVLSTTDNHATN